MTENWIIDASPLILLGKAGQLDWLPRMGRIVVPESVATEVEAGSPADSARQWLEAAEGAACIVRSGHFCSTTAGSITLSRSDETLPSA